MAEALPNPADQAAEVTDIARRHRRSIAVALGLCAASLVAALAMPVGLPDPAMLDTRGLDGEGVAVAPREDLSAFASADRWGGLTYEELEAQRRAAEAGASAEAARRDRMGFVGTTATSEDRVVLLALPRGEVRRIPVGGTLPDGRTVSNVTDTTATLSDRSGDDQNLELFPRLPADAEGSVGPAPEADPQQ